MSNTREPNLEKIRRKIKDVIPKNSIVTISSDKHMGGFFKLKRTKHYEFVLYISKKVEDISFLFHGVTNINKIIFENWDSSNIISMRGTFSNMILNEMPDFSKQDFSNVINMSRMFYHTKVYDDVMFINHTLINLENVYNMFAYFKSKDLYIDLGKTNIKNGNYIFQDSLIEKMKILIDDTKDVSYFSNMFLDASIETIDISKVNIKKSNSIKNLLSKTTSLKVIMPKNTPSNSFLGDISNGVMEIYCNEDWNEIIEKHIA